MWTAICEESEGCAMKAFLNSRPWLILEPIFLLIIFGLLASHLVPFSGVEVGAADLALLQSPPDWGALALIEGKSQGIKWGLLLAAAWLLARMRGYRLTKPINVEGPFLSVGQLLLFGFAIAVPLYLVAILPRWYHFRIALLGEAPPIWNLIYGADWTFEFWLFMAIGSFALIPIVEELFFRGYFLGSLNRRLSAVWAVTLSAVVFALVHLQYVSADFFALYNLAAVFLVGLVYAWSVYFTRSLLPAITGHTFGNLPQPLEWVPYEVGLLVPAVALLVWLVPRARTAPWLVPPSATAS